MDNFSLNQCFFHALKSTPTQTTPFQGEGILTTALTGTWLMRYPPESFEDTIKTDGKTQDVSSIYRYQ